MELNGVSLAGPTVQVSEILEQKTVFGGRTNIRLMRNGVVIDRQVTVGAAAGR